MQGPIALDWLAPYIEAGLERSGIGFKVAIGGVHLGIDHATRGYEPACTTARRYSNSPCLLLV